MNLWRSNMISYWLHNYSWKNIRSFKPFTIKLTYDNFVKTADPQEKWRNNQNDDKRNNYQPNKFFLLNWDSNRQVSQRSPWNHVFYLRAANPYQTSFSIKTMHRKWSLCDQIWRKLQMVTFTEEVLKGKLHFCPVKQVEQIFSTL